MATDEREYAKARQGWSIENLTGFRRTAKQIEDAQHDDLREQSELYKKKLRFFGTLATLATAFFIWQYFLS